MQPVIQFDDVMKVYPLKAGDVTALSHISFTVERGEFISIMGPSGSGKSTLLNLMGCLDPPTSGNIFISGIGVRTMNDVEVDKPAEGPYRVHLPVLQLISPVKCHRKREFPPDAEIRKECEPG